MMNQEEHENLQKQRAVAAHVDGKILSGAADEGNLRAHAPESFKKFKKAAERVIVTHEVHGHEEGTLYLLRLLALAQHRPRTMERGLSCHTGACPTAWSL